MRNSFKIFSILFYLLLSACIASPTQESAGEFIDSAVISTKVKTRLVERFGRKAVGIQVKTYKDEVQLSGFVDAPLMKDRAGELVSSLPYVRSMRNDLIIKTAQ
jgi:osmotically-inducible protein OsmY